MFHEVPGCRDDGAHMTRRARPRHYLHPKLDIFQQERMRLPARITAPPWWLATLACTLLASTMEMSERSGRARLEGLVRRQSSQLYQ